MRAADKGRRGRAKDEEAGACGWKACAGLQEEGRRRGEADEEDRSGGAAHSRMSSTRSSQPSARLSLGSPSISAYAAAASRRARFFCTAGSSVRRTVIRSRVLSKKSCAPGRHT